MVRAGAGWHGPIVRTTSLCSPCCLRQPFPSPSHVFASPRPRHRPALALAQPSSSSALTLALAQPLPSHALVALTRCSHSRTDRGAGAAVHVDHGSGRGHRAHGRTGLGPLLCGVPLADTERARHCPQARAAAVAPKGRYVVVGSVHREGTVLAQHPDVVRSVLHGQPKTRPSCSRTSSTRTWCG